MTLLRIKKYIQNYFRYLLHNPKKYWNRQGGVKYFTQFHSSEPRYEEIFIEHIKNFKPNSLIDIGCGYGRYSMALKEEFPNLHTVGVDISASQIEFARDYCKIFPDIELYEVDGKYLPFDNGSFDMAITYGCLSAVKVSHIRKFFKEIQRITRNYGVFLEYFPSKDDNRFTDHIYWYKHDYIGLFNGKMIMNQKLNENGDTLFIVKF